MSQDKLREHLVEVARRRRAREAADAGGDGPTLPADPALQEALAPLDEAAKERITARILKEIEAGAPPAATAPAEAPRAPPAAKVIPFRRRWPAAAAVAVAAMAAVLVVSLRPDRLPPLPGYEATVSGETALRGSPAPAEAPRVGPGSTLTLVARPKQVVPGPVEASAFLVRGDSARPWEVPLEVSPEGAVRISGTTEALLPPEPGPGSWTAVIVITRPGQPRASAADALRYAKGESPGDPAVQVIQARFDQTGP